MRYRIKENTTGHWRVIPGIEIMDKALAEEMALGLTKNGMAAKVEAVMERPPKFAQGATEAIPADSHDIRMEQQRIAEKAFAGHNFRDSVVETGPWTWDGDVVSRAVRLTRSLVKFEVMFDGPEGLSIICAGEYDARKVLA